MPSSRGASQSRDQTQVSHIASSFFTVWVIREAQEHYPFPAGSSWPRNQFRVSCIVGRLFTSWAAREANIHGNTAHMILFCGLYLSICLRSFPFTMKFSFFACWLFSSSALHFFFFFFTKIPYFINRGIRVF